ncbi:MAG: DMT family transporter [Arenibacterium sp.]
MENLRGALLMTLSMAGFAVEDMFIKLIAGAVPTWQILAVMGLFGAPLFAVLTWLRGDPLFSRTYLTFPVMVRVVGELIGRFGLITAIALVPLSTASAILQATPLAVAMGAAVFYGDPVGWRRWLAITLGFIGVLIVIRPGTEGFDPRALFAVLAVIGLGSRDLVTRSIPPQTSSMQLSFIAFLSLFPSAVVLSLFSDEALVVPDLRLFALMVLMVLFGALAYYLIVAAMRVGEVSFVTPFRYARILFVIVIGMVMFDETPDFWVIVGACVIVASGIYSILRERKRRIRT